jgi:hypothetical protein
MRLEGRRSSGVGKSRGRGRVGGAGDLKRRRGKTKGDFLSFFWFVF